MVTTIKKVFKGFNLAQLIKDVDYWFWALMLMTVAASASIVRTTDAVADVEKGVRVLQVQQGALTTPSQPQNDAYLTLKGVALGSKYKQKGVVRTDLEYMLDGLLKEGKINLLYKQAILAGYDRGLTAK